MRLKSALASVTLSTIFGANITTATKSGNSSSFYDAEERVASVTVYIYDDPVFNHSDLIDCHSAENNVTPWQDERFDIAQNMAEVWAHKALLVHPWRVLNPEDADLFYVPIYPVLSYFNQRCGDLTHNQRMSAAVEFLIHKSSYFGRLGGTDHFFVCTWWDCRRSFTPLHRMLMRRVVLAINDAEDSWAEWGCHGRNITIPYVASSSITTSAAIGGLHPADRTVPFFFVGTARKRRERVNLSVVKKISPESTIEIGRHQDIWSEDGDSYGHHMVRSRFCFCPRGDSLTSRRMFDAIAAGCIPVITTEELSVLPFQRYDLQYSDFAVIAPAGSFSNRDNLTALVQDLSTRSDEQLAPVRKSLQLAIQKIIYGVSTGDQWGDMHPFNGVATRVLMEAHRSAVTNRWECPPLLVDSSFPVAARTTSDLPPPVATRAQWLSESETIVVKEHSLLFCAPRNTGSLQYRMLAKRITGSKTWTVSDDRTMLFDPILSDLPLLDVRNASLMADIYEHNYNKWIKIGVVRDPVTRLLSLYLDNMHSSQRRGHRLVEWDRGGSEGERRQSQLGEEIDGDAHDGPQLQLGADGTRAKKGGEGSKATAFAAFVGALAEDVTTASSAFQPVSSFCGMKHSPFDAVIPFEMLKEKSVEVVKSLPGGIWDAYGASGWGPDGSNSFMEFDYGAAGRHSPEHERSTSGTNPPAETRGQSSTPSSFPRRARDLFERDSCAWTQYYASEETLRNVHVAYQADYHLFGWYSIEYWVARLHKCNRGRR